MRIRMKTTIRGAEDGIHLRDYVAGEAYDIAETLRGQDLASTFLREGWAEKVGDEKPTPVESLKPGQALEIAKVEADLAAAVVPVVPVPVELKAAFEEAPADVKVAAPTPLPAQGKRKGK